MKLINKLGRKKISLMITILIVAIVSGCFLQVRAEKEQQMIEKIAELESTGYVPKVQSKKVSETEVRELLQFSAVMDSANKVDVIPEVTGKAINIFVKNGDYVKKGQTIARLQQDSGLIANLRSAETSLEVSKDVEDKTERLYKQLKRDADGTSQEKTSKRQYDLSVDSAKGQVEMNKDQVANLRTQLAKYTIKAPASGIVNNFEIVIGDTVVPNRALLTLVNDNKIEIKTGFSSSEINKISKGQEVEIKDCLDKGISCKGEVVSVGTVTDNVSKKFPVEIQIENKKGEIRTGVVVHAGIVVNKKEGVIVIPAVAVFEKDAENFVYIINEEQRVSLRKVELDESNQEEFVVKQGLTVGEEVMLDGKYDLVEGDLVEITEKY